MQGGELATIVTLGDYVDRGPSSRGVLERLMNFHSETLRMIVLKCNHEAMMWEACNDPGSWIGGSGGDATLASYQLDAGCVPPAHLA
jgi:serine/threonine protein phosphatase 1